MKLSLGKANRQTKFWETRREQKVRCITLGAGGVYQAIRRSTKGYWGGGDGGGGWVHSRSGRQARLMQIEVACGAEAGCASSMVNERESEWNGKWPEKQTTVAAS